MIVSERKKPDENQNESEGWLADREHELFVRQFGVFLSVSGFRREETMKTKTNLKAGPTAVEYNR